MTETPYDCVEECKRLANSVADQAAANAVCEIAAAQASVLLQREEAAASDRFTAVATPTIIKIKISGDPLVVAAMDELRLANARVTTGAAAMDGLIAQYQCAKALVLLKTHELKKLQEVEPPAASTPAAATAAAVPLEAPSKMQSLKALLGLSPAA